MLIAARQAGQTSEPPLGPNPFTAEGADVSAEDTEDTEEESEIEVVNCKLKS